MKKINTQQAAKIIGVTPQRVSQFARDGRLAIVETIGRVNYYSATEVAKFARLARPHGISREAVRS